MSQNNNTKKDVVEIQEGLPTISLTTEDRMAKLAFALAKAQARIPTIPKNKSGHHGYMYADLTAIMECVKPILAEHGLAITQPLVTTEKGGMAIRTILFHQDGGSITSEVPLPTDPSGSKNEVQAAGSGITYFRRYALSAMLGLVTDDDDDGHSAGPKIQPRAPQQQQAKPREAVAGQPVCPICNVPALMDDKLDESKYYCFPRWGGCGKRSPR